MKSTHHQPPRFHRLLRSVCVAVVLGTSGASHASAQDGGEERSFGTATRSSGALIGILYDLKQTQQRTPKNVEFSRQVGEFLNHGWDESILNNFYRVTRALYTTDVYIPLMDAGNAPRAFAAEQTVEQRQWVIHYKGQVSPPHAGTFRFLGLSDDIMAVAVGGRTVLVADHPSARLVDTGWRDAPRDGPQTPVGPSVYGDWITLKAGEVIDLDIIIGENPGGNFGAWLLVEEQGRDYHSDDGTLVYPAFQLAARPVAHEPDKGPVARTAGPDELWLGHQ